MVIGDGAYFMYEAALCQAFKQIGYKNTTLFAYEKYLQDTKFARGEYLKSISYKIQNKFSVGRGVSLLNKEILQQCKKEKPELVFLYRCRAVVPRTVKEIKKMGITVFSYNNDNPFSEYYPKFFWRHYKNCIQLCDLNYVYRKSNIADCEQYKSKRTEILRSYYLEQENYPLPEKEKLDNIPEVLFLGHCEEDYRKEYIEALAENGIRVGVPSGWRGKVSNKNIVFLDNAGTQYNELINSAKIALVFLSTLNKDTYTRRCFEIPATKTMMLSIYTEDLAGMFTPGKEAVYFNTKDELINKVKYYLIHDEKREKIGLAGHERLKNNGHEVKDRARQIINDYKNIHEK